jgi:hypothetical protein
MDAYAIKALLYVNWRRLNQAAAEFDEIVVHVQAWRVPHLRRQNLASRAPDEVTRLDSIFTGQSFEVSSATDDQVDNLVNLLRALAALAASAHARELTSVAKTLVKAMDVPSWVRPLLLDVVEGDDAQEAWEKFVQANPRWDDDWDDNDDDDDDGGDWDGGGDGDDDGGGDDDWDGGDDDVWEYELEVANAY